MPAATATARPRRPAPDFRPHALPARRAAFLTIRMFGVLGSGLIGFRVLGPVAGWDLRGALMVSVHRHKLIYKVKARLLGGPSYKVPYYRGT